MEKGKIIPLVLAGLLIILSVYLYVSYESKQVKFSKLTVSYKSNKTEYTDLKLDNIIVINNNSFWVVSINKTQIGFTSEKYLSDKKNETNEFIIDMGKETYACFNKDDDCIIFNLS